MATITELYQLKASLDELAQQVRQVTNSLPQSLDATLHDPDVLPDNDLVITTRSVIDAMERLQLRLVPSVLLLADGFFGYLNSKALATVVQLKVPDVLQHSGPSTASQLGELVAVQPERIGQLMDTLVNNGIFTYDEDAEKFAHNRCSLLLCRDHWTQWHLWADLYPNRFFNISRSIPDAIHRDETRSAAQIEYKTELSIFDYLASTGEIEQFHCTLGSGAVAMAQGLAVDYPWQELENAELVELGGGSGDFLVSVMREHPSLRGSLVDLQHVIELLQPKFDDPNGSFTDVASRIVHLYVGDFFDDILPASCYMIKWCLHNWMDNDVVRILRNARNKLIMSPTSRFIIFESVKESGRNGRLPRYGDLVMMMTVNGKERSRKDWARLANLSGWTLERVVNIRNSWVSAIDLRPM
ncbi:hypothetical protein BP6252_07506 [Coleophoma cylindrospora]|uniref:Uncharacterized protein n=1 Tax=Coleophoma cylindrospora TaxID=1849047 RepID=A0A3D8RA61_9HELO|nr:hypothetical protein BP6252_07506 [Coleophoma cylindrospora]